MLFVISFCTAVLAAIGTERVLAADTSVRRPVAWVGFAGVMFRTAISGALTTLATHFADPRFGSLTERNQINIVVGAVRSLLAVGATVYVAIAMRSRSMKPALAGCLLVGVVGLDLWSLVRRYWIFSPPAAELYASDRVIEYLQRLPEPSRVLAIGLGPINPARRDPYLGSGDGRGDGFMVHGVRSVFGYHGNELGRYDELTKWDDPEWPRRVLQSANLRRLLNLQYVYTNNPTPPIPGSTLALPSVKNAAGNDVFLFRLAAENPMAWVAPLAVKVADSTALSTLLDTRFDVRRVALFDSATTVPTQPVPATLPETSSVYARVTAMEPGHIVVALDKPAPANATLVVSENYYPGWRATVDGAAAAVGRADYVLMGVGLTAGARRVELSFKSASYPRGRRMTMVAALALLVALGAGIALTRRKGGPNRLTRRRRAILLDA